MLVTVTTALPGAWAKQFPGARNARPATTIKHTLANLQSCFRIRAPSYGEGPEIAWFPAPQLTVAEEQQAGSGFSFPRVHVSIPNQEWDLEPDNNIDFS